MAGIIPKREQKMTLAQLAYNKQIIVRHNKREEVEKPVYIYTGFIITLRTNASISANCTAAQGGR